MASAPTLLDAHRDPKPQKPRPAPRLALQRDDELDLAWQFNEAEGALGGLRSTFGAMCERLAAGLKSDPGGRSNVTDDEMVDRLDAHMARRRIHRRLLAIGHHARTLERVFEEPSGRVSPVPVYVAHRFGNLAALAIALAPCEDALAHACQAIATSKPSPTQVALAESVQLLADEAFAAASHAYVQAKHSHR